MKNELKDTCCFQFWYQNRVWHNPTGQKKQSELLMDVLSVKYSYCLSTDCLGEKYRTVNSHNADSLLIKINMFDYSNICWLKTFKIDIKNWNGKMFSCLVPRAWNVHIHDRFCTKDSVCGTEQLCQVRCSEWSHNMAISLMVWRSLSSSWGCRFGPQGSVFCL